MGVMQEFDIVIIGAGLSGIGLGVYATRHFPGKRIAILEARDRSGGTWDLFRYPGIRSDSDMYTLGYAFKPWTNAKSIADGPDILTYIRDTALEYGLESKIQYNHRVVAARWSSDAKRWLLQVATNEGRSVNMQTKFIFSCTGYYDYANPHWPKFENQDAFEGTIVHPQFWPENLEIAGRNVVVVGSGATAVTVVPAMAKAGASVTMLQRSPTFVYSLPEQDKFAIMLRKVLPEKLAYLITRWSHILSSHYTYWLSRKWPKATKKHIIQQVADQLPQGYDVATHFTPRYDPWDERICAVPDGDLFKEITAGRVTVVTDKIAHFERNGLKLESGKNLPCDMVVVATGLNLQFMGGMALFVDGKPVQPRDHLTYRGMMYSNLPNIMSVFGYTNSSWTLKIDLIGNYLMRLLTYMDEQGYSSVTPKLTDAKVAPEEFSSLKSGYIQRAFDKFPAQGNKEPWHLKDNYILDRIAFATAKVDDGVLRFS
jgi:cation diffusion facilitator CzcD-associated flavoprotein CzcO